MPSIKPDRNQMFLLPPAIEDRIPDNHPARFVVEFVETLDLNAMGFKQDAEEGRPPYANEMLLSIWLYGLMNRIRSCRKLEKSLYDSMAMIWITSNMHPDHNTLWRFLKINRDRIKEVFKGTVNMAIEYEMVGFEMQAIDGTRIMADVNNDKTITIKGQKKRLAEIEKEIDGILKEVEENEKKEDINNDKGFGIPERLKNKEERKKAIKESIARLEKEEKKEENAVDKDARFMKVRQAGIKQGYNAQAVVDERKQIITGADLNNISADNGELTNMIKVAEKTTGRKTEETLVDKGYYSPEELAKAEEQKQKVIISLGWKDKGGRYGKSNFKYDADANEYICPEGKRLTYGGKTIRTDRENREEHKYICRDYCDCSKHSECTKSKIGRVIKTSKDELLINELKERAVAENWRQKLKARCKIVEPVFGHIKEQIGLRRFSVRGMEKVKAQWLITCAVHNLKKIYGHWLNTMVKLRLVAT